MNLTSDIILWIRIFLTTEVVLKIFPNLNVFAFYPTALEGCRGIVFTHGVRMVGRAAGNSWSGLYLRNRKV